MHPRFTHSNIQFVRLDVDGLHTNPDGHHVASAAHLHIYTPKYQKHDAVAMPVNQNYFENVSDVYRTWREFLRLAMLFLRRQVMPVNFETEYMQWLRDSESITNINTPARPVYAISTAYFDDSGDNVELFAYPRPDGTIRLTDGGWVTNQLMLQGIDVLDNEADAEKVSQIAGKFGLKFDGDHRLNGIIDNHLANLGMVKANLLMAMMIALNVLSDGKDN
jgi:hypothetical protein